ncbi:MAG: hypothetical protein JXA97_12140 [Anaerolineales bacterium]|nr:hypothetical protein [Anaerolineales bacterium]
MMNRDGVSSLYSFNTYANSIVLDFVEALSADAFVRPASPSHGSVQGLLVHMLECEGFFLAQCQGQVFNLAEADTSTRAGIKKRWLTLQLEQQRYLDSIDNADLPREVVVELGGTTLDVPVWKLLIQPVIHSAHHRGELSIVLTGLGHPMPTVDFLLYHIRVTGQPWPFD